MKVKHCISFICLFLIIASTLSSCKYFSQDYYKEPEKAKETAEYEITVSDYSGNSYVLDKAPEGIYVSSPSAAETIVELGSARLVRSCTSECKEIKGIPSGVSTCSPSLITPQMLIDLGIDTVLFSHDNSVLNIDEYKNAGLKVFIFYEKGRIATAESNIRLAGAITFKSEAAEEIINEMRNDINVIKALSENTSLKRSVYIEGGKPDNYFAYTCNSLIGELVQIAGGENIFDAQVDMITANLDTIQKNNPEIIISFIEAENFTSKDIRKREGFENISASKTGQIFIYDSTYPEIRPAPSITDALYEIAKLIGTVEK